MKKVRLVLVAVVAMLFLGIGSVNAQETVIIKVYDIPMMVKSRMIVITPSGESKIVELKNINAKNLDEATIENYKIVQNEITIWKKEGYKIDGLSNSSLGDAVITTIILSKDE
jgi:hypothetical protein